MCKCKSLCVTPVFCDESGCEKEIDDFKKKVRLVEAIIHNFVEKIAHL